MEEIGHVPQGQQWERVAATDFQITPVGLKVIGAGRAAIVEPDFGDADGGIDRELVQRASRDLHLDGQVGRRIHGQVDLLLLAHQRLVPQNGLELGDERLATLINAKASMFHEVAAEGVKSYPGAVELIRRLSGKIPLAICSGALLSDVEPVLGMLSIQDAFDCIITADDVSASKPDPASYALAVQRLQQLFPGQEISPSSSVAIEDTPAGITSAKGAGLKVLSVTNSYPAAELHAADRVVESLATITIEDLRQLVP